MTTDLDLPTPAAAPVRVGQATAVEQSRAAAEVYGQLVVAQQCPRDEQTALRAMRESCRQMRLAERAFYRFTRGGQQVSGPTVHLARELARIWGNVTYGISEMARDDGHGQSEMQAYAWDLQTNTRSSQIFIVPHSRDTKTGPKRLVDLRDVYENNTNQGARRLRQAIWAILPPWLVDEAVDLCTQTLKDGGGIPLPQRISKAVDAFAALGVTADQLEQRISRQTAKWTEHDVAQLTVIYKSLQRGEVRVEDEFPQERVTVAEISGKTTKQAAGSSTPGPAAEQAVAVEDPDPEVNSHWAPPQETTS
jgi:hypothetical protein